MSGHVDMTPCADPGVEEVFLTFQISRAFPSQRSEMPDSRAFKEFLINAVKIVLYRVKHRGESHQHEV